MRPLPLGRLALLEPRCLVLPRGLRRLVGFLGLLGIPRIGVLVAHRASPSCTANSTARSRASPKSTGSVPEVPA